MQNRYVGDIGDFGKYGLLRYLVGMFDCEKRLRLGVLWYLVSDEFHNNDGAKTQYLFQSDSVQFEACDSPLYQALRSVVTTSSRSVEATQGLNVLPPDTAFAAEPLVMTPNGKRKTVQNRLERRQRWVERSHKATETCDIVFADPDNGLECPSVQPHDLRGPKYAFIEDLSPIIARGQSLVVYHHTCRKGTAEAQVRSKLRALRLGANQSAFGLLFRRGSSRAFLIFPVDEHKRLLKDRVRSMLDSPWNKHFTLISEDM